MAILHGVFLVLPTPPIHHLGVIGIWWKIDDHSINLNNGAHGFPQGFATHVFAALAWGFSESGGRVTIIVKSVVMDREPKI